MVRSKLVRVENKCNPDIRKLNTVGMLVEHCKAEDMGNMLR